MATKRIPLKAATVFHSVLNPQDTLTLPPGTEVLYSQFDGDQRASLHVATYFQANPVDDAGVEVYQCYRLADPLPAPATTDEDDFTPTPPAPRYEGDDTVPDDQPPSLRQVYAEAAAKPAIPATPPAVDDGRELVLYRSKAGKLARYLVVGRFTDAYQYGPRRGQRHNCVRLKPADWVGEAFTLIAPALIPCPAGVVESADDNSPSAPATDAPAARTAFASDIGVSAFLPALNLDLDGTGTKSRWVRTDVLKDTEGETQGARYACNGVELTIYND